MSDLVLTERIGSVFVLTYNNPGSRNSLAEGYTDAIGGAIAEAEADPAVGAIVFRGAGDYFCSGGNLNKLATSHQKSDEQRVAGIEALHTVVRSIRDCSKPVIAAVEGGAAGAGVSLVFACDLIVADREASFSVAYIKVGLTPDGGATAFLSESIPRQLLTELCLTGVPISAERLADLGAINRLVDSGAAQDEAVALAKRLAYGPPRATARIKQLARSAHSLSNDEQLDAERDRMAQSLGDAEATEGIAAFFEKRRADYASLRAHS